MMEAAASMPSIEPVLGPLPTSARGARRRSLTRSLVVTFSVLGVGWTNPAPTSAQTSVPPSAPPAVDDERPTSTPPSLIGLLRPCVPGLGMESGSLGRVPPGIGVWGASCERRMLAAHYVSGAVTERAGQYYVRTEAGTPLRLVSAVPHVSDYDMPYAWMQGFVDAGDAPLVLQGAWRSDGTFEVHGYALRLSPAYESFTYGRVVWTPTEPPRTYIASPHFGAVEIGDEGLRARLVTLPRLGVILPGEPVKLGASWVYQGRALRFFGLARPTSRAQPGPGESIVVMGDMALSFFQGKPIELPRRFLDRTEHRRRFWVEGTPVAGPDGTIVRWVGTYASPATDLGAAMPAAAPR
jgi:hypothetical protein